MATTSRSGAGGKIITHRRKQRLTATPYHRTPLQKSPNWFAGVVVPSARAIASGAGKILSSIFSDSGSSSSEDEAYASEDDIVNDNLAEIPYNLENTLNEKNGTQYWTNETKKIIVQLIMKETFSREECGRLTKVLNSRIVDWSMEAEENSVASSPENVDSFDKAVQEAKRWFHEKKVGLCSVTELAQGTSNLEHNRRCLASGSWKIQEELRRLGSRATADMLCRPTKTDESHFNVAQIRMRSPGDKVVTVEERMTDPQTLRLRKPIDAMVDAGVRSLTDVRRWHEESEQEDNSEGGASLKLERELKRLQTSVNYNRRARGSLGREQVKSFRDVV